MFEDAEPFDRSRAHEVVGDCLAAGIEAARPERAVRESLAVDGSEIRIDDVRHDLDEYERVVVLGGGNAAGRVASAVESVLGERIDEGVVGTDNPTATTTIEQVEGAHPIPSEGSVDGAERVLELAESAGPETLVVGILTGGGSALLSSPAGAIDLSSLQATTAALLESGASIDEINTVRKHCSTVKGGQLARAATPASVLTLVCSDVVGNDLGAIASGPLAPDQTTYEMAVDVVDRYGLDLPENVHDHLEAGIAGKHRETPGPDDPVFENVSHHVLVDNGTALDAARSAAQSDGVDTLVLSSRIEGDAREAARTHVAIAEEVLATGDPATPPVVLLSGGETTVTVTGDGTGGPNQEFALQGALECSPGIVLASVDTDGIDGATDAAGAIVDADTVDDATHDAARRALDANDATPALGDAGALLYSGFTGTNVNDLRVVAVGIDD